MNSWPKYKTKQRELLLCYLETVRGVHITAGDVCEYFREQGATIGQSTVYRRLEGLVDEGLVNKYVIDVNGPACFEYVGADSHADAESCFHCKCEKCGKLIHLRCDEIEELQTHMYDEHRFKLNPKRTVFYGLCEKCVYINS
ncbi:MAG: transcriptional repressor [Clostridiales bacterium]|nr:transcriptional repressor [Clostridiales bacterium]